MRSGKIKLLAEIPVVEARVKSLREEAENIKRTGGLPGFAELLVEAAEKKLRVLKQRAGLES